LQSNPQGVLLPIKAQAGARANGLKGIQDGRLRVAVTQAAEKGKANKAIQTLLARSLGLRRSQFQLLKGATHATKLFLVSGLPADELSERIRRAITPVPKGPPID